MVTIWMLGEVGPPPLPPSERSPAQEPPRQLPCRALDAHVRGWSTAVPMNQDLFTQPEALVEFDSAAKRAVYDVIRLRRDVRHFQRDRELDEDVLQRILAAAHAAPSVGLSQPWGFLIIRSIAVRARIRESFQRCREREAARYDSERRARYLAHKLEGIVDAPLNICVAVDLRPSAVPVLGTTAQPEALRASAYCAVQNLWLAARAEGIGVGWVSIVEPETLRAELALPERVEPVAYLCVGHPAAFRNKPMLEETGWSERRPLESALHRDGVWRDR